jgi:hypothetical protein
MMGITTKTVTACTCDLCGVDCKGEDSIVNIQVHPGDGRDVGPGHMTGVMRVNLPYRVSDGIVCVACKLDWLRKYVDSQSAARNTARSA